ncbi:MAG: hypothetical protein M1827_005278 [Pycnora praestabilis]|nr:MAG: hypothetical protein M1827_005278 [Pycnora praestabilis]
MQQHPRTDHQQHIPPPPLSRHHFPSPRDERPGTIPQNAKTRQYSHHGEEHRESDTQLPVRTRNIKCLGTLISHALDGTIHGPKCNADATDFEDVEGEEEGVDDLPQLEEPGGAEGRHAVDGVSCEGVEGEEDDVEKKEEQEDGEGGVGGGGVGVLVRHCW